jgi:urease accessory protein
MTTPTLPDHLHQRAGTGDIHLQSTGSSVSFPTLSATYPLKLLSPRIDHPRTAIAYILSYGGGLVGGDRVQLNVQVDEGAYLMALTQARNAFSLSWI